MSTQVLEKEKKEKKDVDVIEHPTDESRVPFPLLFSEVGEYGRVDIKGDEIFDDRTTVDYTKTKGQIDLDEDPHSDY